MAVQSAFAPYRLPPGALPEEATRLASAAAAEPLVVPLDEPLPGAMVSQALADIGAGHAFVAEEACRAADGTPSGSANQLRACYVSARHRTRVEEAVKKALAAGFAGVCLDRPDAPLAQGVLGSGFCPDCQRAFSKELVREYGDHFTPIDYLAMTREALAHASGALGHDKLAFGRDFWRFRTRALEQAIAAYVRVARDASRSTERPFEVTAQFEAVGPAQLAAARHLDAAIFPVKADTQTTAAGLFRLIRAAMGHRACAAALSGEAQPGAIRRLASVAAACGLEVIGLDGKMEGRGLAPLRQFSRQLGAQRHAPGATDPVAECAIVYSQESDLWTGGDHRLSIERVGDALAALQIQAPVVMRMEDVPLGAAIVLADAAALAPLEATELRRRVEAGANAIGFGSLGAVDDLGRENGPPLPPGKPGSVKVGKGLVVRMPPLPPLRAGVIPEPRSLEPIWKSLGGVLGRSRRAVAVTGRVPMLVMLYRNAERLDAHLVTLGTGPAQGATLFLGLHVAGTVRRARFQSASGADENIVMNSAGYSISTILPSFEGYAVLSVGA